MPTINNSESGSSVRTKLNSSITKTDLITVTQAVNLDTMESDIGDNDVAVTAVAASVAALGDLAALDTVDTADIADGSITNIKIADLEISPAKLQNNSVSRDKIVDAAVNGPKILDGSVDTNKLGSEAVTAAKIANLTITAAKIADDQINDSKLSDTGASAGSYTNADITVNAQGRITAVSNGSGGGGGSGDAWGDAVDADVVPDADGTRDLGSATSRFANLHVDSIDLDGDTITSVATKTAPSGVVVGTTDTQTLTNKTLTDAKITSAVNTQTGATYTLVLADASKYVLMNSGSAQTLTIPTNASVAFPTGTSVQVTGIGAGTVSVEGDTGVDLNGTTAGSADLSEQWAGVVVTKIGTDAWMIQGNVGAVS